MKISINSDFEYDEEGISFIPGINIDNQNKKAFIQIISNDTSYFVNYSINDFEFNHNPFCIKIGNNTFSRDSTHIDIRDSSQNLIVNGDIKYSNSKNIKTNIFKPNIMGPFSYIPYMEKDIFESICSIINLTLKKDNSIIFSDTSLNCGLEIVQE